MSAPDDKLRRLELLLRVGVALSAETDTNRLLETILLEAKELTRADGGTLYVRQDEDSLHFAIMRTDSLGIALGGTTGRPTTLPPIPLRDPESGTPNHRHIASYAALRKQSINIPNAYDTTRFDFSGTKAFDARSGYRSVSFLTIPMLDAEGRVVGVLQLINSRDAKTGEVVMLEISSPTARRAAPDIPDGRVHHWAGAVFVPGTTTDAVVQRLKDNAGQESRSYEDVLASRLLSRDGDSLRVFMKLRRTSIITVTYNTEHAVEYRRLGASRASSHSFSAAATCTRVCSTAASSCVSCSRGMLPMRESSSAVAYEACCTSSAVCQSW